MAIVDIDENRWPIVIITLSGKESCKDIKDFLSKLESFQSRDEEFCFVLDLREMHRLAPEARDMLFGWLKNADLHELAGTALVVSSPIMRLYLSTVLWFARSLSHQKVRFRHKTMESLNEAYEWSRSCLHLEKPGNHRV